MHDVLQIALAGRGEQHPGDPGAGEVLGEPLGVAPAAGVVDHDRVVDAVPGVVDAGRVGGVDDLDQRAVGQDRVVLLVDGDGALERPVHGVPSQQAGPLDDVVGGPAAHDDGAQSQALAAAGVLDQDAGEETSDPAEPVEHDIGARARVGALQTDDVGQFLAQEVVEAPAGFVTAVGQVQPGQVDRRGAEPQPGERLQHRQGLLEGKFDVVDLPGEAVRLEQPHHRLVDQAAPVHAGDDVVVPVQPADQRDHRLRQCFPVDPRVSAAISILKQGHTFLSRPHRCAGLCRLAAWAGQTGGGRPGIGGRGRRGGRGSSYSSSASSLGSSNSLEASSSTLTSLNVSTRTDFTNRSER